jgi:hypothetical protein
VVNGAEILATGRFIAGVQEPGGAIGWPDGHVDAWDHIECVMALSVCGLLDPGLRAAARAGYGWLRDTQRADGSWARSWPAVDAAGDPTSDSAGDAAGDAAGEAHHAAYPAVGVWHEYLVTGDLAFVQEMWPMVRSAVDWTLALATPRGEIMWERDATGAPGSFALLSGCASIYQSLHCAVQLAKLVSEPRPDWEQAADQLGHLVAHCPEAFADKSRFAMDWYYPVLCGAVRGPDAASRIAAGWSSFVVPGRGCRCVSDQPWVTVAETCELVLALEACGMRSTAIPLFDSVASSRRPDGSYWTGWQYANNQPFPAEWSSWTAASVVLAWDALTGCSGGAGIFRDVPGS